MTMKVALIGSTGMLGGTLSRELSTRGFQVVGVARSNATTNCDIRDEKVLETAIQNYKPDIIINAAAEIDINLCETDYDKAYAVNGEAVSFLASQAAIINAYFIQISTDHYYTGDKNKLHSETDQTILLNSYARTKYYGELKALEYKNSLVVRTNIVGFAERKNKTTFVDWLYNSLKNRDQINAFEDYFTSSIDIYSFSKIILDTAKLKPTGLYNIASSEVFSKADFIKRFANRFGFKNANISASTLKELKAVKRAESLGLDTSKISKLLNRKMPTLDEVIENIFLYHKGRK